MIYYFYSCPRIELLHSMYLDKFLVSVLILIFNTVDRDSVCCCAKIICIGNIFKFSNKNDAQNYSVMIFMLKYLHDYEIPKIYKLYNPQTNVIIFLFKINNCNLS